jgi:hypothetical protein
MLAGWLTRAGAQLLLELVSKKKKKQKKKQTEEDRPELVSKRQDMPCQNWSLFCLERNRQEGRKEEGARRTRQAGNDATTPTVAPRALPLAMCGAAARRAKKKGRQVSPPPRSSPEHRA